VTRRQNRVFVVLDLPGRVPDLIIRARAIIEACAAHLRRLLDERARRAFLCVGTLGDRHPRSILAWRTTVDAGRTTVDLW
jgi:hypothetical protein